MCYQLHAFSDLVSDCTSIRLGDGELIYTHGRGTVHNLPNIYYVPDLRFNLLSVRYLLDLGYTVTFRHDGTVHLSDSTSRSIPLGSFHDSLFRTTGHLFELNVQDKCLLTYPVHHLSDSRNSDHAFAGSATYINPYRLLHQRFAHCNDQYIDFALKANLVSGVSFRPRRFSSPHCESCKLAKSTRVSSTRTPGSAHHVPTIPPSLRVRFSDSISTIPDTQHLTSLHSFPTERPPPLSKLSVDLKGPIDIGFISPTTKRFCLMFTCAITRYRFVAFLASKDETVTYTAKLIAYLRKIDKPVTSIEEFSTSDDDHSNFFSPPINDLLTRYDIKSKIIPFSEMKSDRGTEFVNTDMENLLDDNRIFHSTTSPHSPHQNGIAERSNRTVFDLAAANMHACGMAIKHWYHAVSYVVHTLNHLPNRALSLRSTPYIEVFGTVPDVSYFRTFGCDCYTVLPDHKRPSFGLRAAKGKFLGYCQPYSLAYKVLVDNKVVKTGHTG